ncbi:MAG: VanZ family protein [Lachnospiraceae bacterium]|nr:VanZ family protein [Lachnospiraceae bacterium]
MTKRKKRVKYLGRLFFVLYILCAVYFLFFSDSMDRTMVSREYRYNLRPFFEIRRFVNNIDQVGIKSLLINVGGNIVCFMPFGYLLPTITKHKIVKNIFGVVLLTFLFSLSVETIQLVTKVGAFDVDDLMLNTFGGFLGYIFMRFTIHKYTV